MTVDRVPAVCAMLARAFADDPMLGWSVGDAHDLAAIQYRLFELIDVPLAELGLLWEVGDAAAAALWIPPASLDTFVNLDTAPRPAVREMTTDAGRRWDAMWDWIEERLPEEPLWFLDHIGVEPSSQGSGLGRALIEHGLALARAEGIGAFLETGVAANVSYYKRFGFQVFDEGEVPLGGTHVWFMRCDP